MKHTFINTEYSILAVPTVENVKNWNLSIYNIKYKDKIRKRSENV